MWSSERMTETGYYNFTTTRKEGPMGDKKALDALIARRGFDTADVVIMEQVHGANVYKVVPGDGGKRIFSTDGIFIDSGSAAGGFMLGILTADCVPVFGINKKTGAYGAFHAGWKGIERGIIENAVKSLGGEPGDLIFALGPHICGKCYNVGPEFGEKFPAGYSDGFMSLKDEILSRLKKALVPAGGVDIADVENEFCTFHNKESFYSYRRDSGPGRMLSAIAPKKGWTQC